MVRDGLGTAAEQGWTPDAIADYLVDAVRAGPDGLDADGAAYGAVQDYLDDLQERDADWSAQRQALALYWTGRGGEPDWDRLAADIADYVERELDAIGDGQADAARDGDGGVPYDAVAEDHVRQRLQRQEDGVRCAADADRTAVDERALTPGYTKVDGMGRPRHDVWLTSVHARYCPAHEEEHVTAVDYLAPDEARDAVARLLDDGEASAVADVIETAFHREKWEPAAGFVAAMVEAGKPETAADLVCDAAARGELDDVDGFVDRVEADERMGAAGFGDLVEGSG